MSDQEMVKDEQPVEAVTEAALETDADESVAAEPALEVATETEPDNVETPAPEKVAGSIIEEPVESVEVAPPVAAEAEADDGEALVAEAQPTAEESVDESPQLTTEVGPMAESQPVAEEAPLQKPADEAPQVVAETEPVAEGEDDPQNIFNLKPRQYLTGKVKNITAFGAFIDLGLPQDGLVHISELARKKVEKVEDVVSVGQEVDVWVKKIDRKRGRISLTMIKPIARRIRDINDEDELEGTVTRLEAFGAFVDIDSERDGLVHISQITHDYIKHPQESLEIGQKINVKVLKVNRKKRQIDLSIKALLPPPIVEQAPEPKTKKGKNTKPEFVLEEQEPVPTAMAVAFANLQEGDDDTEGDQAGGTKESIRRKRQQEELIARTLEST